jgi:L-threonylcarbamoyladenylate synthase
VRKQNILHTFKSQLYKDNQMKVLSATEEDIKTASEIVRTGGVVVYPTETVYGIGCAPQIESAAKRICEIKGRADKPLPLACSSLPVARKVVEFNPVAERLAEVFWPGPLMLVLPAILEYGMYVTHGSKTLGVRVPDHEVSRSLASKCGGVIVSTSANKTGEGSPTTAEGVIQQIGGEVDVVLDGGPTPGGIPSTVLDLSGEQLWILRVGPITGAQIKEVLGI